MRVLQICQISKQRPSKNDRRADISLGCKGLGFIESGFLMSFSRWNIHFTKLSWELDGKRSPERDEPGVTFILISALQDTTE